MTYTVLKVKVKVHKVTKVAIEMWLLDNQHFWGFIVGR